MAIMIPSVISPEVKSDAERKIFGWFQNAPGTEQWIVLHSLGIAAHNKVIYGETDFLVLAPALGIFALEVKGGRVRRENGSWYFTNRYGLTTCKARSPFEQAKDGIFSIVEAIRKRADNEHKRIGNILFGYGVMFPDIEFLSSGVEEDQWQVFDYRDGNRVRQFIHQLSYGAKLKWERHYGPISSIKLPDSADVQYIASLLRGDFDFAISIRSQLLNAKDSLIELTKEQYRCLDQLDDNPRCLIYGPAGTGKTFLAIEEVKKSVAQGNKVALFCYNSNLADWLSSYFEKMPSSIRPKYVGTFHKYMTQVTKLSGALPPFPHNQDMVQSYYQHDLPRAAVASLSNSVATFDKVIVDEAQDLIQASYLDVLSACLTKGLARGRWTMFGDFSMQAIYLSNMSGADMIEELEKLTSFIRFRLTINCRNTKQICKEIETVTRFVAPNGLWTKVDGPPVQYITWSTMEEQCDKLNALLKKLQDSHIGPNQITILSPRKRKDSVVNMLVEHTIKDFRIPVYDSMTFCTIQGYKGLENTAIILTDIESYSEEKLMYVGLSRACSGLFILESDNAKKEYDNLLIRRLLG